MSQNKASSEHQNTEVPLGKMRRVGIGAAAVAQLGIRHAAYRATAPFVAKEKKPQYQSQHYENMTKTIMEAFSKLRGPALKIAQLLSLESDLLPPEVCRELSKACYQVPPLNRAIVRKVMINQFGKPPEQLFDTFEPNAFAAASIGQVHRATLPGGQEAVVKIQYPGIAQTIQSDMELARTTLLKWPHPNLKKSRQIIHSILDEVQLRFSEEVHYLKEQQNMNWFKENTKNPHVHIPESFPQLSTDTILTMGYLKGIHLEEWLNTHPNQKEKNHFAQLLWDFFWDHVTQNNMVHADPNPGNFLVMDRLALGVLDFGCIKRLDPAFTRKLLRLLQCHLNRDIKKAIDIYNEWGMIPSEFKQDFKRAEAHIHPFREWLILPFVQPSFDFAKHPDYMSQRLQSQFISTDLFTQVNSNFIMFHRAYTGILNILSRLKATVQMNKEGELKGNLPF